jgi:NTE family protein
LINYNNFSLVLSGGGALGIAHLGVLEDLENSNISPNEIIGTSMGGIIGACLAIGLKEKEIYKLFVDFSSVSNWVKFSLHGNSVIKSSKIEKIFSNIFGSLKIKDTKIPLKIITTNLSNGDVKVFDDKSNIFIKDALLATMAIPGIFEEQTILGTTYVDGFLSENLAINQASLDDILAIDVLGKNSFIVDTPNNFLKIQNVFDMLEKALRLLMYNQTKANLAKTEKNILLLEPYTKNHKTFHFHKYKEIKQLGKNLL